MAASILILNGPNLNLLGARETDIYGTTTLADIEAMCAHAAGQLSLKITARQSNSESELIGWVQNAARADERSPERGAETYDGIIINAGGFSHTSVALMDALLSLNIAVVEVHLSNIYRREEFRHHSYVSRAAAGVICGFGPQSYTLALEAMAELLKKKK